MNRLTIKDKKMRGNFNAEYAKLADLEDIEEELGIELITLFKALKKATIYDIKKGCYVFKNKMVLLTNYDSESKPQFVLTGYFEKYELKDYGKTWALTKEELEE